jgi:protein TonB
MGNFYREYSKYLKYPPAARKAGISGKVFITFLIHADGRITDIGVEKGIGGGCDEEAVRAMEKYASRFRWKPGAQRGKPVTQRMVLPITFMIG